jgi:sorbose reductase
VYPLPSLTCTLLVLSGARGLGYEMTRAFCEAGAAGVGILDVLQEHGETAVKELNEDFGVSASFYKVVSLIQFNGVTVL